jgi:hypothetical protein
MLKIQMKKFKEKIKIILPKIFQANSSSHGGAEISADDIKCSSIDEELLMEEEMKNKEQNVK